MENHVISSRPWLLLPMEIKVREFESKVMLACIAATRGYGVLLGRNGFNKNGNYPRGIYLDKCISPNKFPALEHQVNKLGNFLVSLDVEGLVYQSEEKWLRIRTSKKTVDLSSLIFTWGREQCEMINRTYDAPEKVVVTGSPTADLWEKMHFLYSEDAETLKSRFGDLILIPSNFATVINANGSDFIERQFIKNKFVINNQELALLRESLEFHRKVFDCFVRAIPALAEANRQCSIIVRPHPGDDIRQWRHYAKKWPDNVKILYQGTVSPWIMASRVVVHNSCTTAVEAFAMEKPAIAYIPHVDDRFDQNIPNPLSQQAASLERVLELVERNLNEGKKEPTAEQRELYSRFIKTAPDQLAGERMLNSMDKLDLPCQPFSFRRYGLPMKMRVAARKVKRRVLHRFGNGDFSYAYRQQKNPGVSLGEVCRLVDKYKFHLGCWQNVEVHQVEEDLFCFHAST